MALDPRDAMERMYRHQRHFYDLTRKFYLLGRDQLLRELPLRPGDTLCEVGCGTARNLVALARRHPGVDLYGIDASAPMLETAQAEITRAGLADRIRLCHGLAEELDAAVQFGLERPFDTVVFAYSLSMIPSWRAAIERAIDNLRPGGTLAIVDFWDQGALPRWFARSLQVWLALFDVHPRMDLLSGLELPTLETVTVAPRFRRYAVTVCCTKAR